MMAVIDLTFLLCGFCYFCSKRLLNYLRYLQQDDYRSDRFLKWLWSTKSFDLKGSLVSITTLIFLAFHFSPLFPLSTGLIVTAFFEENPQKTGKIRLKMTERAKRIQRTSLVISSIFFSMCAFLFVLKPLFINILVIVSIQLIPFVLLLSLWLLSFDEARRQKKLLEEAKNILADVNPYIIGITGSYGKTSSKHALATVLQIALGATFWPEKGVNTPMGITREIRTKLKKGYRYAVIEMAAYGKGSIQRLCNLTPPQAGLITCVGVAHLERFGSEETILNTKSELAESIPEHGLLVCNGDNAGAREIARRYPKKHLYFYGFGDEKNSCELDVKVKIERVTVKGSHITIHWQGKDYSGFTPLVGKPLISNIAGVFAMAVALNADPSLVMAALSQLTPIDNRLQIHEEKEIVYLKDAYNSNPTGFAGALEILSQLPGSRRLIMTPGMIELGLQQENYNHKIGKMAGSICDIALVVGKTNQRALIQGLEESGLAKDKILFCETRESAFQKLKEILQKGDLVLIENDLPDLYEGRGKF